MAGAVQALSFDRPLVASNLEGWPKPGGVQAFDTGGQVTAGHLRDACVSFMVGYFPIFSNYCRCLIASGVGMIGLFLDL